jgi:hypothetical protein
MNEPEEFPCYREMANKLSRYRISSPTTFTEVQHVGTRFIVHDVQATTYPELLRIAELIEARDGTVRPIPASDFEDWLLRAGHRR